MYDAETEALFKSAHAKLDKVEAILDKVEREGVD